MKYKSLLLLLIFSCSLIPLNPVLAEEVLQRSLDDAISLMYVSEALLLDVDFPEEVFRSQGLFSPSWDYPAVDPDNAALAAALHALKGMRNDLDAKCNLLVAHFRQQGKDCEAEKVQATCDQQKQEINAEIGKMHDKRGDRRRGPTKFWHWLKRSGRGFWYRIGPIGRNFLRKVGPEALQMAATGGLSGGVLKNLLKHTAKSMGRDRIRQIVYQGVARLLQGQIELAQAAGVDICEPDEEETIEDQSASESDETASSVDELDLPANWTCGSNIGYWGDWLSGAIIEKSELIFNLQTSPPDVSYDFTFHGIANIPDLDGNPQTPTEEIDNGKGIAMWDGTYFYGSVTINRESYLYYTSETSEFKDSFDKDVIGALSPDHIEIHLCFHDYTRDQFDSIKNQPFDQLKSNCYSKSYFFCTPQE